MTRISVLFVCSGNRFRSPIAERLFAARLGPRIEHFGIGSAGTVAEPGTPLGPRAAEVIADLGGAVGQFTSRRLTAELVDSADVVLGLAREHREAAVRLCPGALRRCFVLEEFVRLTAEEAGRIEADAVRVVERAAADRGRLPPATPGAEDIADPQGLPAEAVRWCAVRIDQAVRRVAVALTGAVRTGG